MPRYRNPESEPNIRRIDSTRVHGFQFHAQRLDLRLTRLFSDTVSGGKPQALDRARVFRDRVVPTLPKPTNSWGPRAHDPHSNTGVMGVSITESANADGSVRTYVQCTARSPGSRKPINKRIRLESEDALSAAIEQLVAWRNAVLRGHEF